ncbi:MAG: GNAT family N-acetyltransferase [Chitinophagaceae bacterium]
MHLQPILSNTEILLQPLELNNFDDLYMAASDPLIWEQHPDKLRYQKNVFQKYFDSAIKSKGAFLIVNKLTNEIIGSSRFYEFDATKSEITIGYTFIARKYWGTNCNQSIKKLMLEYAFNYVETVLFTIGINNIRSQKAIKKIGAQLLRKQDDSLVYFINKGYANV